MLSYVKRVKPFFKGFMGFSHPSLRLCALKSAYTSAYTYSIYPGCKPPVVGGSVRQAGLQLELPGLGRGRVKWAEVAELLVPLFKELISNEVKRKFWFISTRHISNNYGYYDSMDHDNFELYRDSGK